MSNSIAPGSSADVNVKVTALTTNPNVPAQYKTIILKKNLVNGVNILTQEMMSATNTKYVIKYDYTLAENITIPANCILEFDGGSISGAYTITGANTGIQAGLVKIFNTNINFSGNWNLGIVEVEWFGAKPDNITDCSPAINKAISFVNEGTIHFNNGTYCISNSIKIGPNINVIGINKRSTIIKKTTIESIDDSIIELLNGSGSTHYGAIKNLMISGNDNKNDYGIQATKNSVPYLKIEDIDISNVKSGIYISVGTWLCTIKNVFIYEGEYGLYFDGTSTSCSLSNIYVMGVSKSAYCFIGVTYSFCDTLCADACTCSEYGVYNLSFSSINFSGCGCESGSSAKMINANNGTKAVFTSCAFFASDIEDGTIISMYDASLKFHSCTFGHPGEHNSSIYHVASIGNCSFDNCSVKGTYIKGNMSEGHIEINDKTGFTVFKNSQAGIGITGYIGDLAPTEKTRNIYTDGINKISDSVGHSGWNNCFRQGDVILNNYPNKNGIFAWESLNDPTIQKTLVGTISEIIASNKVKLTSLDYNTTQDDGVQIMKADVLSFSNGYAGEVTDVDYTNKIITLWNPAGSASVGVGGVLQTSSYRMNNRFSAIQIISAGISTLRPSDPTTGICHFDETLGKPIWWNGSAWVDATGTLV